MKTKELIAWFLNGDISIQYQTYRDLLNLNKPSLQKRIATEGWGGRFLSYRNDKGHWGRGFYQPKWTSTHYTLLDLKYLFIAPENKNISESIQFIFENEKNKDGGINPSQSKTPSDVCVNGMVLNYACYFKTKEEYLKSVVDFILSEKMGDGGFNCRSNRGGASHSSLHTTLSVLEGILEFKKNNYKYRLKELYRAELAAQEFILMHKLFRSDKTDRIIKSDFLKLRYPCRWYYDILKALDYFQAAGIGYDKRMEEAIEIIIKKRNKKGQWLLAAKHPGHEHFEMEKPGTPSRWNTLRAMRVLKHFKIES